MADEPKTSPSIQPPAAVTPGAPLRYRRPLRPKIRPDWQVPSTRKFVSSDENSGKRSLPS